MKLKIVRFNKSDSNQWNDFLASTRNGIFLFNRAYMEYHEDRFTDHSLMIYRQDKLVGLFPANEKEKEIHSHAGLTYGGLIMSKELKGLDTLTALQDILDYYRAAGFNTLFYKAIPYIFHNYCCQEDLYALFRLHAELYRRDISSVVELGDPIRFSESKRQSLAKCKQAGLTVSENKVFDEYWSLLASVLSKFGVQPVHSLEEIKYLQQQFPGKIRLFEARLESELVAGLVIYDYDRVVHTQYMANSKPGRDMGALDFINAHLISEVYKDRDYYSFGISTEEAGRKLNEGLLQQKEMMGGRGIVHDFYKITI